jgi:hypothetical protein
MYVPGEWVPPPAEPPHDHKGHSEEKCVRCGWVMGHRALNCMNDDTPHVFPSQQAEVERLTDELQQVANEIALAESQEARCASTTGAERYFAARLANPEYRQAYEEARREQ